MPHPISRRAALSVALAGAATAASAQAAGGPPVVSNRAHFLARPEYKAALVRCFSEVLGCGAPMTLKAPGLAEPILAFRMGGGSSVSVEFTPDALTPDQQRRGAWLELRSDRAADLQAAVLAAGYPKVEYVTKAFYFAAPGGQVFGLVRPDQAP